MHIDGDAPCTASSVPCLQARYRLHRRRPTAGREQYPVRQPACGGYADEAGSCRLRTARSERALCRCSRLGPTGSALLRPGRESGAPRRCSPSPSQRQAPLQVLQFGPHQPQHVSQRVDLGDQRRGIRLLVALGAIAVCLPCSRAEHRRQTLAQALQRGLHLLDLFLGAGHGGCCRALGSFGG